MIVASTIFVIGYGVKNGEQLLVVLIQKFNVTRPRWLREALATIGVAQGGWFLRRSGGLTAPRQDKWGQAHFGSSMN